MNIEKRNTNFINRDKLYELIEGATPTTSQVNEILNKALKLKGLNLDEVATFGDGIRIFFISSYSTSLPPSKKNVTCGYFSVSAILSWLIPLLCK